MKTPAPDSAVRACVSVALLFAALCGLTGCLSKPALTKQTFAFSLPTATGTNGVNGVTIVNSNRVLGIRSLQIATPFDGRSFVYRPGEFSYVRDPYAEFMEPPAEELISSVREWLRQSGGFDVVAEAGSALRPDLLVEINISRLYGDFRIPKQPTAVLEMHCLFLEATNGVPEKMIFQADYSRRVSLSGPNAAALMAGWNFALSEILAEISSDLQPPKPGLK